MKRIICLYGGPGSGKSTTCAGLFYHLKKMGYDCEMNREYVKEWVWESRSIKRGDQTYFFAQSARKERIYMEKEVEFIISDSPLVLTHFYGLKYDEMERECNTSLIMLKHHHEFCKKLGYKVDHFFIERHKEYKVNGRNETEETAVQFDRDIRKMLQDLNIKVTSISGTRQVEDIIASYNLPVGK